MNVEILARQYEVTPAVRDEVEDGLTKLQKILGDSFTSKVILTVEKHRFIAEITVKRRRGHIVGLAEAPDMVAALNGIGISVSDHALYLTITSRGAIRVVPVRQANNDGEQNEYDRTKEIGLVQAMNGWIRLYADLENRAYQVFPAPAERFTAPQWPELKPAKIFKLAFRDKGRLVDSTEHPLFKKWAARDAG